MLDEQRAESNEPDGLGGVKLLVNSNIVEFYSLRGVLLQCLGAGILVAFSNYEIFLHSAGIYQALEDVVECPVGESSDEDGLVHLAEFVDKSNN